MMRALMGPYAIRDLPIDRDYLENLRRYETHLLSVYIAPIEDCKSMPPLPPG